jgi:hypothetical protein
MRPELTTAVAVDNSASIQPARSLSISWGKTVQISGATSAFWLSPFLVCRATCNRAGLNLEIDKPKPPCELCLQARFLLPSLHLLRSFRIGGC